MPELPQSLLIRRAAARDYLGVSDQEFSKLVAAGVLAPVYLVWDVIARNGKTVLSANQLKAAAYVETHAGHRLCPAGHAYYRTAEVKALGALEMQNAK